LILSDILWYLFFHAEFERESVGLFAFLYDLTFRLSDFTIGFFFLPHFLLLVELTQHFKASTDSPCSLFEPTLVDLDLDRSFLFVKQGEGEAHLHFDHGCGKGNRP
jgi:hypothetical protein